MTDTKEEGGDKKPSPEAAHPNDANGATHPEDEKSTKDMAEPAAASEAEARGEKPHAQDPGVENLKKDDGSEDPDDEEEDAAEDNPDGADKGDEEKSTAHGGLTPLQLIDEQFKAKHRRVF